MISRLLFLALLLTASPHCQAQQLVRQIGRLQVWRGANTRGHIYKPASVASSVAPLCTDQWDQYAPMNALCPTIDGDTCVTGCVAHAMAQLMYFYKYPESGIGEVSYIDSLGCGDTLTADFSQSHYQWGLMRDDYSASYTQEEALAAATLLRDCGIAVRMTYGTEASSAYVAWQPYALANYFGYDRKMQLKYRNFYTQLEWDSLMFTELDAGRPLVVGAWSRSMGHSFVCDGYDEQGYFHIRWGNPDGDADGWYYFTWLTPDQPQWHDVDNPETGFNLLQCILVGAEPMSSLSSATECHEFAFGTISPLPDNRGLVVRNLANVGWNTHEERVGLALKSLDAPRETAASDTRLVYTYTHDFLLEEFDDTTYTDTILLNLSAIASTVDEDNSAEKWKIVPVFEDNGSFVEARTQVGTPNYLEVDFHADSPELSLPQQASAMLQISDMEFPDTVVQLSKPAISFSFKNEGTEYSGRIYLSLVEKSQPLTDHIFLSHGLSIASGETLHRDFNRTTLSLGVGTYYLRVLADVDLFTDSLLVLYEDESHPVRIVKDASTDILAPQAQPASTGRATDQSFDLNGRPLRDADTHKGILIRRGKKVWQR